MIRSVPHQITIWRQDDEPVPQLTTPAEPTPTPIGQLLPASVSRIDGYKPSKSVGEVYIRPFGIFANLATVLVGTAENVREEIWNLNCHRETIQFRVYVKILEDIRLRTTLFW